MEGVNSEKENCKECGCLALDRSNDGRSLVASIEHLDLLRSARLETEEGVNQAEQHGHFDSVRDQWLDAHDYGEGEERNDTDLAQFPQHYTFDDRLGIHGEAHG